jgi:hypothetical protein
MPHSSTPRRPRRRPVLVALLLAGLLAATPGAPAPGAPAAPVQAARPDRALLRTTPGRLVADGRASIRALARERTASPGGAARGAPPRVAWRRPGRAGAIVGGGGDAAVGGGGGAVVRAPVDASAIPAAAIPAVLAGATEADPSAPPTPAAATGPGPGVVGAAWFGLDDSAVSCGTTRPCVEPANPSVAASATHVVQMVREATRITDRAGGAAVTVSNRAFFNVGAWSPTAVVADPQVVFDPARGRWIATLFAGTCTGGAIFLAVSATASPTGSWDRYHLAFDGAWPNGPVLGISSTLVGIGVNETAVSCGTGGTWRVGAYRGTRLHLVDRAALEDGGSAPAVASTDPDPTAFSITPAVGLTVGDPLHAVVALDDGSTSRADLGHLVIDGSVADGLHVTDPVNLTTEAGLAKLADPPTPVDAGGLIGIQGNALDLRPAGATWRAGRLLVASTNRCTVGTATRPCGRVTELEVPGGATPTVRQDLRITPTSGFTDTFVPGAGYADDGTIWAVYSQAGSGRYVSSWARRQLPGDPPGAWSAGTALIAAGRGPYGGTAGAGLNERWGEHVGVARDPAEPGSVWQGNQLADTGGGWTTRVARLGDDPAPPTATGPRPRFVTKVTASTSSVRLDLTWTAADPGSGVARIVLERSLDGGPWAAVATLGGDARTYRISAAYGRRYAFRVVATDHAGTVAEPAEGPAFTPTLVSESSGAIAYGGTWSTARSSSYLGGRTRYTGVARRRATLTFTGLAVAWVATKGPTRGSARVIGDGALQGTYSTYLSSTHHRQVVTGRTFTAVGRHTYRIEVVGTRGHPRVDVDAFVILR